MVEAAALEDLADDVRSVWINRQGADMTLKGMPNEVLLMVHCDIIKDSLNCVSSLLVAAD